MKISQIICLFALAALIGCSADRHRRAADDEVYKILNQRTKAVLGEDASVDTITSRPGAELERIPPAAIIHERYTDGQRSLTLPQALELAVKNNRAYQLQRETLYLSGLTLTGARHRFIWQASESSADLGIDREKDGGLRGDSDGSFSLQKLFKTGASATASQEP